MKYFISSRTQQQKDNVLTHGYMQLEVKYYSWKMSVYLNHVVCVTNTLKLNIAVATAKLATLQCQHY